MARDGLRLVEAQCAVDDQNLGDVAAERLALGRRGSENRNLAEGGASRCWKRNSREDYVVGFLPPGTPIIRFDSTQCWPTSRKLGTNAGSL